MYLVARGFSAPRPVNGFRISEPFCCARENPMTLVPSLNLFLGALVLGAGLALGWCPMAWLVGKVLGAVDRATS